MFGRFEQVRVYLRPGHTDMRRQINGLSTLAKSLLKQDPFSGHLFAFCNRRRKMVRVLYWDRNGFCLWSKRLERDQFPWPDSEEDALEITAQELAWLLNGIDFRKAHGTLKYSLLG